MLELLTPRIVKGAEGRHRQLELDEPAFTRSRTIIARAMRQQPILPRSALFAELDRGGISTAGQRGIHILQRLSMERMLCYGPHAEKQPTFVLFDDWIPTSRALDRDDALRTIAERFFVSHGPASMRDFVGWTGLTVVDAKIGLHLAEPVLERIATGDGELWMSNERSTAAMREPSALDSGTRSAKKIAVSRAHLLPGFDEFMLGYKDRSAALAPRHAARIVPGKNGMFLSTLVLDGQVRGTWRRSARAHVGEFDASPFTPFNATHKRLFAAPAARYAHFLGTPVALSWAE